MHKESAEINCVVVGPFFDEIVKMRRCGFDVRENLHALCHLDHMHLYFSDLTKDSMINTHAQKAYIGHVIMLSLRSTTFIF
jgi:hypothetical protein